MMINTFKFSKGLIISIVYNVIILTFVKCDGSGTEDNKNPPVPDYEPGGVNDKNYFEYHLRSTYPGRLKLDPKIYFASKYNCLYMALPELEYTVSNKYEGFENFKIYLSSLTVKESEYKRRLNKLNNEYYSIKDKESDLARAVQKTYIATQNAYLAVDSFENSVNDNEMKMMELKINKDIAIQDYLTNQMSISTQRSTISVMYDEIKIVYEIKNFELYIDPTEEMFYRSKVIEEEILALNEAIKSLENSCYTLNYMEYDEVIFLYVLLPNEDDNCETYEKMKIQFTLKLQESFENPTFAYKYDDFLTPQDEKNPDSYNQYNDLCNKMKSKYVVNNENYLSYLIRLKAQGYIGIHHDNHKFLYGVRTENYMPLHFGEPLIMPYTIDMDLHEEHFKRDEIQPIENNPSLMEFD